MNAELRNVIKSKLKMEFNPSETLLLLAQNRHKFWSWGVSNKVNIENKGLLLKVSGHHHKGYVLVTLAYDDTYTVDIVSTHGKVKDTYEMVYFDMLFETIDDRIERIAEYVD